MKSRLLLSNDPAANEVAKVLRICEKLNCSRKHYAKGLCKSCYTVLRQSEKRAQLPKFTHARDLIAEYWELVDRRGPEECWPWKNSPVEGYGRFYRGTSYSAHRIAYELLIGPIPEGLQLDHLCRNTICCNPAHLEPVTGRVNNLRGVGLAADNSRKTHCKNGHEFTLENTYNKPDGERRCRTCSRAAEKNRDRARR